MMYPWHWNNPLMIMMGRVATVIIPVTVKGLFCDIGIGSHKTIS